MKFFVEYLEADAQNKEDRKGQVIESNWVEILKDSLENIPNVVQIVGIHVHESSYFFNHKERETNLKSIN